MTQTVILLDGDIVAFQHAAAAEKRTINVEHIPTGKTKAFKTRTEFKKAMQEKGKEITEDYLITDVQTPEPLEFCLSSVKAKINNLKNFLDTEEIEVYVSGQFNFRDELPLPSKYKGGRKDSIRPVLLKDSRNYLQTVHKAKSIDFIETDDEVTIRSYELLEQGKRPVICTVDKDAYQTQGVEILNLNSIGSGTILIPDFGELTYDKKKGVKGIGMKFLCHQLIYGDATDCYSPYELVGPKVFGEKSSYDLLDPLKSPQECLEAVIKQYKEWYPKPFQYVAWNGQVIQADWLAMLKLYWQCAYMKRTRDGSDTIEKFFGNYGVEIG